MKKPIARVWRCARWSLLAASGLGTCLAAYAQSPPSLLPPVKNPASWAVGMESSHPAGDSQEMAEMRVELAWMANPLTFPYQLEARTVGTVLEIRGEVLTQADREQALRLAQEESGMRVVDRLQINPRLSVAHATKPASVLQRQAMVALGNDLTQRARDLSVSIWTNGQILVKGSVPTFADKLSVSRSLRRVGGCSCVINQLKVENASGGAATRVASLGSKSTADVPATAAPILQTSGVNILPPEPAPSGVHSAELSSPAASADAGPKPIDVQKNQGKTVIAYQTKWRRLSSFEVPTGDQGSARSTASSAGASRSDSKTPSSPTTTAAAAPTLKTPVIRPEDSMASLDKRVVPAAMNAYPTTVTISPPVAGPASQATLMPPVAKPSYVPQPIMYTAPATPQTATSRPGYATTSGTSPLDTAPAPSRLVSVYTSRQTPVPQDDPIWTGKPAKPQPKSPPAPRSDPYVTTGVVIVDPAVQPASLAAAQQTKQAPPPAGRPGAYVSSGVVSFDAVPPQVEPKMTPAQSQLQLRLQQRIAAACGMATEDVRVSLTGAQGVQIRLRAKSTQACEALSMRILDLPELGPYEVGLDITVRP